jgi:hypothetical protein
VIAGTYFLFQLLVIYTANQLEGRCLFTFWAPTDTIDFSPYWLVWSVVVLLFSWLGTCSFRAVLLVESGAWAIVVISVAGAIALVAWGAVLLEMWRAFQYERGVLSPEDWFRAKPRLMTGFIHECDLSGREHR